ncbi:hypothetical protein B484DRAFT_110793 [Ochromonadaceae sp. CCMP2298]|nr:hypothetical protein B484DRAFT_110793 [Ochromonadaceae sp. CCMP2298]
MQQHFPSFRDGGDAINKGSALVWAPALQTWLCGDVEGKIFKKTAGGDFEEIALLDGVAISALAVHPTQEEIMVAADDSICKRSLTNLDHSLMEQVSRTEVSFAHMQYDHEGDFLFTAAKDGDVIVLNVQNGQAEQCERIKTDGHPVASLALSADSRHIALVDAEGALFVYRLEFQARPDGRRLVQVDLLTMKNGIVAKQVAR